MKDEAEGIAPLIIAAVVVVIVVVVGVGVYVMVSRGGGGGVLGTLPVYPGAQETNDTTAQQMITSFTTGMGLPSGWSFKAYTTQENLETVIGWYRT